MSTETQKDNPFSGLSDFYIDQMEKMAPKLKQGIEDWYAVYSKVVNEGIKWQEQWLKQWANTKDSSTEFTKGTKSFVQKVMDTQKDFSTSMIDATVKGFQSLKATAAATNKS